MTSLSGIAQKNCSTPEYNQLLFNKSHKESRESFEKWIGQKLKTKSLSKRSMMTSEQEVYTIPVVVHIIHDGEAIGEGSNISDAQILSQIAVLNLDFRRFNSDTINTNEAFRSIVADVGIEFILAKQDPEGLPSNGITRTLGTQTSYNLNEHETIANLAYWDAENYFNIWVTNLSGGLLGFSQYPVSDIPGMEDKYTNRATDGVVIDYKYFGRTGNITNGTSGRTATHEVGHFLGLIHIWGDGNCDLDDFCDDTPNASEPHFHCDEDYGSCSSLDMTENYMDYTEDACMNSFTMDQAVRMRTVLENSPRRISLLTSAGLEIPPTIANNLGIKQFISPNQGQCETDIIPIIQIRNYGSNKIKSHKIELSLDGLAYDTIHTTYNDSLDFLEIDTLFFPPMDLVNIGAYLLEAAILSVNELTDLGTDNNSLRLDLFIPQSISNTFTIDFETMPTDWFIRNPDASLSWENKNININGADNKVLVMNNFEYYDGWHEEDEFISPIIDIANYQTLQLKFDIAHAQLSPESFDELFVRISNDCGNTYSTVYHKIGEALATNSSQNTGYQPLFTQDFRTETIDLSHFIQDSNIQISFVSKSDFSNNIYLDNISLSGKANLSHDIAITSIKDAPKQTCEKTIRPQAVIKNHGQNDYDSLQITQTRNNETLSYHLPVSLLSGEEIDIPLQALNHTNNGNYTVSYQITPLLPLIDEDLTDNIIEYHYFINDTTILAPYAHSFESIPPTWGLLNNDNDITWEPVEFQLGRKTGKAIAIKNYENPNLNSQDWLISPGISLVNLDNPYLHIETAYGVRTNFNDQINIYVSSTCEDDFSENIWFRYGIYLGTTEVNNQWAPSSMEDFIERRISLKDFAGAERIHIAIANTNLGGNNIYLRNFNISPSFINDVYETPQSYILFPNPVKDDFTVTFNLNDYTDLNILIYNSNGQLLYKDNYDNVLKNSFPFSIPNLKQGLYYFKVIGNGINEGKNFMVIPQ